MEAITRVCLIGPQSTGKSELARELARHFTAQSTPEFARDYATVIGRELTVDDVAPIAAGQMAIEDRCVGRLRILDTDLLSTVVYARFYYGSCPRWVEEQARMRRADLYLLLSIDTPFVDDAVRDSSDKRGELFERFRSALREFGAIYEVIEGSWDERREAALRAISTYAAR